ncbi:NmrA family NAD(P)-binding protein [Agrobacterium tumefaciens]|uniref:NmrA family NAD(P)-binding protein n=1 Tax=Agrobacterium tumefaciens TaxID=358 RepID=UPI000AF363F1
MNQTASNVKSRYDTVIGCAGYAAGIDTPMKLAKAALQSGIPRYFPWQFGVDFEAIGRGGPQDIFDAQLDVRELLRSQNKTEWVIISTGMFMSYLFEPEFGVVDCWFPRRTEPVRQIISIEN